MEAVESFKPGEIVYHVTGERGTFISEGLGLENVYVDFGNGGSELTKAKHLSRTKPSLEPKKDEADLQKKLDESLDRMESLLDRMISIVDARNNEA